MKISRIVTALAAGTALSFTSLNAAQAEQLKVVSSFTIIGDMVQNVGGAHVQVVNLAGHNVDLHHFEPKPSDVKKLTESEGVKLLFINGLEFEPWVERIRASSGFKGKTVVLTEGVKAIKFEDIHDHDGEHEHDLITTMMRMNMSKERCMTITIMMSMKVMLTVNGTHMLGKILKCAHLR